MSSTRLPDFEGLALLARVAEERSFAGAARALNLSVATVSRAITRLEDRLGARVLNRTSRKVALTDFGRTLAERGARMLREAEEAESAARELSSRPRGTVNLAVPMSFGLREVSPLLPAFVREYPEITLNLHLSDATVDLIGDGFDAALRIAALPDSSLIARRLRPMGRFLVASPDYIARYGRPQTPAELNVHHCLGYAYRARTATWHLTHTDGREAAVTPTGPLSVTNIDALLPALLDGIGIAELPCFVADPHVAEGRLEILLPDWKLPGGGLYFITPAAHVRPARIEVLSEFLARHLSRSREERC
ncbi:putative transcriptional regulatory protein, LysR family [Bradyrhizobium sp. ORS 278]|uniref:LysR family transcriptional regulator n=1 Tax=Bradyrhizobium sp. (strain ORS 278) TaxID=114615 RepID=UPI0001507E93|nr:LysR family transcriptional regulator [Bradyrhizobium sp. ORS 278]CAL73989.1 putative transcriptional regulatory protein, LysR family [Bradyrhizobium sp. ORS 278]